MLEKRIIKLVEDLGLSYENDQKGLGFIENCEQFDCTIDELITLNNDETEELEETRKGVRYSEKDGLEFEFDEYDNTLKIGKYEYLLVNDSEKEKLVEERSDQYIEDCVLGEIPEYLHSYFDREKYKEDMSDDGSDSVLLGSYDGNEIDFSYDGIWFYGCRTN